MARHVLAEWSTRPWFAIVLERQVVGDIGLYIRHENGELHYVLARPHWGQGIIPEAARAVIGWGFERYALHKVYAFANVRNRRSWRVLKKLGMTREGVLRGRKVQDEYIDDVYYGILRTEWDTSDLCM